jgi:hypothetical protein
MDYQEATEAVVKWQKTSVETVETWDDPCEDRGKLC